MEIEKRSRTLKGADKNLIYTIKILDLLLSGVIFLIFTVIIF